MSWLRWRGMWGSTTGPDGRRFLGLYGGQRWYRTSSMLMERAADGVAFTRARGLEVVYDPSLNQGTNFSEQLRERMHIRGLVPPSVQPMEMQVDRIVTSMREFEKPINKYSFLQQLLDRNTVLFYRVLCEHFEELAPIVYTPTVGEACQTLDLIYRRAKGMWYSVNDVGAMKSMTYNWPEEQVDIIVVTDGGRILGLGDLGTNGMAIAIGKLNLYVAGGGINPLRTLPMTVDVGTDNESLLNNPRYLGVHERRLHGDAYFAFMDEWMDAVTTRWPDVCIQFEDFGTYNAVQLLNKYRNTHLCFNDDIQSTGCIALATILASLRARGKTFVELRDERIVIAGAGSAGLGVAEQIAQFLVSQGMRREDALRRFWMLDNHGLLGRERKEEEMFHTQHLFKRPDMEDGLDLVQVLQHVKPTTLIGLSAAEGLFTSEVLREMAKHVDRPVVLPLSNPSSNSECTAEEAFRHTDGRAIFASGSPFPNVTLPDGSTYHTNQCNNIYSFPGMGLAVSTCRISRVTDKMFHASAVKIASLMSEEEVQKGILFPRLAQLREVSAHVAAAVLEQATAEGLVRVPPPEDVDPVEFMRNAMWQPTYNVLVPVR